MAYLRGFGCHLPSRRVTNRELAGQLGCEEDWIREVSGIEERRYAEAGETVEDLAVGAAEDCLARAGGHRVGLLVMSTATGERQFPGPAAGVAARLGLAGVPAIDLPVASAGSLLGLVLAGQLTNTYGDILVVAAEKMSTLIRRPPVDRNVAILFGDGAGAGLVSGAGGAAEIHASVFHSDGSFQDELKADWGGPLFMNGRAVILQASRKLPRAIEEVLAQGGRKPGDVAAFLLHQANLNLTLRVAQSLGAPPERFYSNIQRYGNTSSASMLIAAAEWSREQGFGAGQPVVFGTFGAGFHWGAMLAVGV